MKKIVFVLIVFLFVMSTSASSNNFVIKDINFNKEEQIINKLPKENTLTYKINYEDKNKDIIDLSKKVTYLLLGPSNNEREEDYYKRHKDFLNIRYAPDVPLKDGKEDINSQEYKDNLISSFALPSVFLEINALDINYSTFGDITVSKSNDLILSTVVLPSITMKEVDDNDSSKYNTIHTNLVIYYFFKEYKGEYKLLLLVAESKNNIEEYLSIINDNSSNNSINIVKDYNSTLNNVYNITSLRKITNNTINNIYENNKDKIVKIVSFYKDGSSFIGNGFFIDKGLVVTTWDYIKRSLINGDYINIISNNKSYKVEGIVTINKDSNIAVLKLVDEVSNGIKLANNINIGDPVISISSQVIGYKANKGLLVTNDGYYQSTIPMALSDEGSLLFNSNGEVVGMSTSLLTNSPSSFSVPYEALAEIKDKFSSMNFNDIKTISFDELKKDFYISYGTEEKKEDISDSTWNKINEITNISNNIHMSIIKSSYQNGIVSIRYKNNISNVRPMKMSEGFRNNLLNNGFKETLYSDKKCIYEKGNYEVILIEEFNYLIVIMVI